MITASTLQGSKSYETGEARVEYVPSSLAIFEQDEPAFTQSYAYDRKWKLHQRFTALHTSCIHNQRPRNNNIAGENSIEGFFEEQPIIENPQNNQYR